MLRNSLRNVRPLIKGNRWLHNSSTLNKGSVSKHGNNHQQSGPILAIRREDASIWERRAPLAPHHVRKLVKKGSYNFSILYWFEVELIVRLPFALHCP
jgi:hypothetical protein